MTGFGVGDCAAGAGRVFAEIRSVNQRFFDVRARLPRELAELTLFAEQVARERLRRGRVELVVHLEGAAVVASALDKARARAAFQALTELRDELAPGAEVPLSLLAAVPDLWSPPAGSALETLRSAVKTATERAIEAMEAMFKKEGDALAADLRARSTLLRKLLVDIGAHAEGARDAVARRLRDRVTKLLEGVEAAVDPSRLETELALIADRSDVAEELTRLGSHLDQFEGGLDAPPGEPVGRRLDFLLQEMLRETNTLGSKAQDALVSHHVVAIKVELERLREQVQNVE